MALFNQRQPFQIGGGLTTQPLQPGGLAGSVAGTGTQSTGFGDFGGLARAGNQAAQFLRAGQQPPTQQFAGLQQAIQQPQPFDPQAPIQPFQPGLSAPVAGPAPVRRTLNTVLHAPTQPFQRQPVPGLFGGGAQPQQFQPQPGGAIGAQPQPFPQPGGFQPVGGAIGAQPQPFQQPGTSPGGGVIGAAPQPIGGLQQPGGFGGAQPQPFQQPGGFSGGQPQLRGLQQLLGGQRGFGRFPGQRQPGGFGGFRGRQPRQFFGQFQSPPGQQGPGGFTGFQRQPFGLSNLLAGGGF